MSYKKKILIVGPILDFGGREIMTNLWFHTLEGAFSPSVLSTVYMTKQSVALKGVNNSQWYTLPYLLYKNNFLVKITSLITKAIYRRKERPHLFIKNKLIKPFVDFNALEEKNIIKFLKETDLIIYSDEITGKWLKIIIDVSEKNKIPLLFCLTGKIKSVPNFFTDNNYNFNILSHSKQNVILIKDEIKAKIRNVDQTTAIEDDLLNIEIKESNQLTYGFLGRFSEEKGINELIDVFSENKKKLIIAGNGPFLNNVLNLANKNKSCFYLGELNPNQLIGFFSKIDVLIIPSHEEGGPLVGVEAMAGGKLIISTKVGAMPERIEDTGNHFWFSHLEKDSLEKVIAQVEAISETERLKIRHQIRDKYIKCNSIQSIKNQYLELINLILKQ